jgi:hypothetical protein
VNVDRHRLEALARRLNAESGVPVASPRNGASCGAEPAKMALGVRDTASPNLVRPAATRGRICVPTDRREPC